ncbi:MarR family winged helix-turn-helix transcriptional regulator [Conexibacter sp. S30A1]|uniref:MarR family winged helix-turn-helix transcriptional regulator n=1 Tax=Conexibacter sp. S30A1 TaxID=2937800 RepID=UPI00200F61FB|nr:MarR family transcriptional regulator [Conexibacter sp. S30A1]
MIPRGAPTTPEIVASALAVGVSLLSRRLRQPPAAGELTLPQRSALAKIERNGPTTASALAKLEQISPQAMGVTVASLESGGLIVRSADPSDGRRVMLSTTAAGRAAIQARAEARNALLAEALAVNFSSEELERLLAAAPLLERLAQVV